MFERIRNRLFLGGEVRAEDYLGRLPWNDAANVWKIAKLINREMEARGLYPEITVVGSTVKRIRRSTGDSRLSNTGVKDQPITLVVGRGERTRREVESALIALGTDWPLRGFAVEVRVWEEHVEYPSSDYGGYYVPYRTLELDPETGARIRVSPVKPEDDISLQVPGRWQVKLMNWSESDLLSR